MSNLSPDFALPPIFTLIEELPHLEKLPPDELVARINEVGPLGVPYGINDSLTYVTTQLAKQDLPTPLHKLAALAIVHPTFRRETLPLDGTPQVYLDRLAFKVMRQAVGLSEATVGFVVAAADLNAYPMNAFRYLLDW